MNEQSITFTVTLAEANGILQSLAQLPFAQVVDLISKLKEQAQVQLQAEPVAETTE